MVAGRLDAFFRAFSEEDGGKLVAAICRGAVTGADLARELNWTRDKVSRRTDDLQTGGIVEKRRDGRWVRTTPQLEGVEAAQAWMAGLRSDTPPSPRTSPQERYKLAPLFADEGRRSLLSAMHAAPGATQAELIRACGLSQPVASRGLTRLVDGGLADRVRVDGRARYTLRAKAVESFFAWLVDAREKLARGRKTAGDVVLPAPGADAASSSAVSSLHPASSTPPSSDAGDDHGRAAASAARPEEDVAVVPQGAQLSEPEAANDPHGKEPDGGPPTRELDADTPDVVAPELRAPPTQAQAA